MDKLSYQELEQIIIDLQPQITKLILDNIKNNSNIGIFDSARSDIIPTGCTSRGGNIKTNNIIKGSASCRDDIVGKTESFIKDDSESLYKSSKAELIAICKIKKLTVSGTKQQLIDKILGKTKSTAIQTKIKTLTEVIKPKANRTPVSKKAEKLIEKIKGDVNEINTVTLRKNKWENHEHLPTKLVFNTSKQVIGIQNRDNGKVEILTKKEIEICKQYKFEYILPENLNNKDDIDELDEIEEIDELDEIEYEEVEEYEEYEEIEEYEE